MVNGNYPPIIIPEEGMGVTLGIGSDRYPATIIEVSENKKTVIVQQDIFRPAKGYEYYGNQVYEFEENPIGRQYCFTLRKNGRWKEKGSSRNGGFQISFRGRSAYSDPSF
jgi:hypothetical protein